MFIPNDWKIILKTNVVAFDDMGYPLRLFLIEETKKRFLRKPLKDTKYEFIDVAEESYNEEKDVVFKWEDYKGCR